MANVKEYLTHCSGIYTMLAWIEKQTSLGTGSTVFRQTIFIPPLGSRYFALGTSTNKKAKNPFLAIQPNESQWLNMISWDHCVIRNNDPNLYLISAIVKGDDADYPDIPSFALCVAFDTYEKLGLLSKITQIDGREYFMDTDNTLRVDFHSYIFRIPLKHIEKEEPYLIDSKVVDYSDLMFLKEKKLQSVFSTDSPPEFKGELADIPESRSLFKKLKDKLL